MNEREDVRKYLEFLHNFVQHPESVGFIQTVAIFGEFYWVATLIAELKAGKTVDEVLNALDETQVVHAKNAFDKTLLFIMGVLEVLSQALDRVLRLGEYPHPPDDEPR